ncbi:putative oxidoreductase [Terriglobus saanensis SP1PR4]|uniref:Putative oxidoreductase n=1 Tax=Terriglobus saanensis (strain ATCC BAA-1853 / DSM 23119 / SP1PR4) TaxID=401053 RepID=E8V5T8_TERSS|nr:putative oxidoreductase [Terriglobus saanensis SP1PR4]
MQKSTCWLQRTFYKQIHPDVSTLDAEDIKRVSEGYAYLFCYLRLHGKYNGNLGFEAWEMGWKSSKKHLGRRRSRAS